MLQILVARSQFWRGTTRLNATTWIALHFATTQELFSTTPFPDSFRVMSTIRPESAGDILRYYRACMIRIGWNWSTPADDFRIFLQPAASSSHSRVKRQLFTTGAYLTSGAQRSTNDFNLESARSHSSETKSRYSLIPSIACGLNSNRLSRPVRTLCKISALSNTRRCLVIAWRVSLEPSLS